MGSSPTKILAFDTATNACSAALAIGDVIDERFEVAPRRHSALILPMVEDLLHQAQCKLTDLDAIAVGCGPGSFMGVRIATGVAQGLAFAAHLPVITVSSLQALAQTAADLTGADWIAAAWDARMEQLYWGGYQRNAQGIVESVILDQLADPHAMQLTQAAWCAAGNAWAVYQDQISEATWRMVEQTQTDIYPHAAALAKIAMHRYAQGELKAPAEVEPIYLRDQIVKT